MTKRKPYRILAFDISLSSPGVAVVEIAVGKPKIIDMSHVKTDSKQSHSLRTEIVESWATLFIAKHSGKGFDTVIREDFHGQSSGQNYPVFAAWSGVDRAVSKFGLTFDKWQEVGKGGRIKPMLGIPQSKVKLIVVGKGKAEKDEVADAVRKWTGFSGEFAVNDESDAVAIAVAYGIQAKLITKGSE
jgi:crossover junction endodeoxyribonuclease RuvC